MHDGHVCRIGQFLREEFDHPCVELDCDDVTCKESNLACQQARAWADLDHSVFVREVGGGGDGFEDATVDKKVLTEMLVSFELIASQKVLDLRHRCVAAHEVLLGLCYHVRCSDKPGRWPRQQTHSVGSCEREGPLVD